MFEPRKTQTKVKHNILDRYLKAWGSIIFYGAKDNILKAIRKNLDAGLHLVYVDCFAGCGRYAGEFEDFEQGKPLTPVFGSPIIGIYALDSLVNTYGNIGVPIHVNAILIEEKPANFEGLKDSLKAANLFSRSKETNNFYSLNNGEIAIVNADSTNMVDDLLKYTTSSYRYNLFAFYFLDDYGPTGIPLKNVSKIISASQHDTLINMPYQDLHKKQGSVRKMELTNAEIANLNNYDEMFGGTGWQTIVDTWKVTPDDTDQSEELEFQLANFYRDVLRNVDPSLSVKSIPLKFPDRERTMFHLYLTTHNATGSIRMNKIFEEGSYTENHLRFRLRDIRKAQGGAQGDFLDLLGMAAPPKELPRNKSVEISELIKEAYSGQSPTKRQIYELLADELYTPGEINKAFTYMRDNNIASFKGPTNRLRHGSLITVH